MSDKAEKPKEAKPEDGAAPAKKKGIKALLTKLPVILGGAMIIEAILLVGVMKMLSGGPAAAEGAELATEGAHGSSGGGGGHGEEGEGYVDPNGMAEIVAIEMRAPNKLSGRTFLYDVSIYVSVKNSNLETVKSALEARKALISDRVRTIIAQSDPSKLDGGKEPGLETLRRQVKYQLDEMVGPGLIDEVLVPRCIPYRADF